MDWLASLFVLQPLNILLVAIAFVVLSVLAAAGRAGEGRRPKNLLVPAAAWGLYAVWEWFVLRSTPEANIRVDLLVIWPVLGLLTLIFAFRAFRRA